MSRSGVWHRTAWVTAVVAVMVVTVGEGATHHQRTLDTRLNNLVERIDSSIQEKAKLMNYKPAEEGEQETYPEDMQDYVNNAPWTRRASIKNPLNSIDMQMIKMASQNAQRVKLEGKCQVPQQRCEVVRSPNHPADTVFLPACALLHRCSEDTGCCLSNDNVCAPIETEIVQLFFYAFGDMRAKIEVMTFQNHTRCSCQSRNAIAGRPDQPNCQCTRYYTPTVVDGQCTCECLANRSKCRRFKKGRRFFSSSDIRCISSGACKTPACEYGPFLKRQRRCTKRREQERYITSRK